MADYYVDTSATYDGDGTASTGAASAGAAGAANDLLSLLSNTHAYVTLAAGDTVYIRTGTGASFEETLTVNKTTLNASHTAPLTWVFDDGSIWASPGTFTIFTPHTYTLTIGRFNHFKSADHTRRGIFETTSGISIGGPFAPVAVLKGSRISGCILRSYDAPSANGRTCCFRQQETSNTYTYLYNCELNQRDFYHTTYSAGVYTTIQGGSVRLDACEIKTRTDDPAMCLICKGNAYHTDTSMFNCHWSQRNDASPLVGATVPAGVPTLINGLVIAGSLDAIFEGGEDYYSVNPMEGDANDDLDIRGQLINGFGSIVDDGVSRFDYNPAGNYPYRDAALVGGAGWSYRVAQRWGSDYRPAVIGDLTKQLTAASGTKTLTVELLVNNNYTNVDDAHFWLEVTYQDASGNVYHETSRNTGTPSALAAGSGGWSSTTYASQSYTSKKITLTTSNAIGQYTPISVRVLCTQVRPSTTGFFFIDPSIGIS